MLEHVETVLAPRSGVYGHGDLARLLAPRTVAIVGASARAGSFGDRVFRNLADFDGEVHLVNARYDTLYDRPCHPSVSALPVVPDCAVLTIGREAVEPVVAECAALGVGGVIVVASGYAETGKPERAELQRRLARLGRETGLRIAGPNSLGSVNYVNGAGMTFSAMPKRRSLSPDAIGIASQSGAIAYALSQAVERGASVSHVLTAGNSCDVDVADYVAYLADDPACRAIACVFEGSATPLRFIAAARRAFAAGKPLVVYKMATGAEGARAAMSHTGSLAGSDAAYASAFASAGVIAVDRLDALVETARFFAKAPVPKAYGVAVIATSGGAAIMAADKAEKYDVDLPQPDAATSSILEANIPEYGSPRNPCDITAQVLTDPESFRACMDALMADRHYGALVTAHAYAYDTATIRLPVFSDIARRTGKIVCNVWMPEWRDGPGARETEIDPHLALFTSMDRCMETLAAWHGRARLAASPIETQTRQSPHDAHDAAARMLAQSPAVLTEREAKRVLACYGIPVCEERLAKSPDDAVRAAQEIGYPVAVKVESADIPHKTEAGVVRLALHDEAAVRDAASAVLDRARSLSPQPDINGVLVQRMATPGVEVIVGGRVDPLFGPLVVVGLGGIMVELLHDTALELAPVSLAQADAMLRRLKGFPLLAGFRGKPGADIAALAKLVALLSEFIADHADRLAEVDVNPLICSPGVIVAVDALIVQRPVAVS